MEEVENNDDWQSHRDNQKGRQKVSLSHINREKPHRIGLHHFSNNWTFAPCELNRIIQRTALLVTCSQKRRHSNSVVPRALSLWLYLIFIIRDLINEHNGGRMHYSLSRITLKKIIRIYYYSLLVVIRNLTSQSLAFIIPYSLQQIHLTFPLSQLPIIHPFLVIK